MVKSLRALSGAARFLSATTARPPPPKPPVLTLKEAGKRCEELVKYSVCVDNRKHDFYSYIVGQYYPDQLRDFYYGVNAFMLEMMKLPYVSKEKTVCISRSMWWEKCLKFIEKVSLTILSPVGKFAHGTHRRLSQGCRRQNQY